MEQLKAAARDAAAEPLKPLLKKGDTVYRKGKPCTVVLVGYDTEPAHVVVRTEEGNEVGSEEHLLARAPPPGSPGRRLSRPGLWLLLLMAAAWIVASVALALRAGRLRSPFGDAFLPGPSCRRPLLRSPAAAAGARAEPRLDSLEEPPASGAPAEPEQALTPALLVLVGFAVGLAAAAPSAEAASATAQLDLGAVWSKATGSAFKGGVAGLLAGVAQVLSFMWLRTSMNYQYFNGGDLRSALTTLWAEGGIGRLYQGV